MSHKEKKTPPKKMVRAVVVYPNHHFIVIWPRRIKKVLGFHVFVLDWQEKKYQGSLRLIERNFNRCDSDYVYGIFPWLVLMLIFQLRVIYWTSLQYLARWGFFATEPSGHIRWGDFMVLPSSRVL